MCYLVMRNKKAPYIMVASQIIADRNVKPLPQITSSSVIIKTQSGGITLDRDILDKISQKKKGNNLTDYKTNSFTFKGKNKTI